MKILIENWRKYLNEEDRPRPVTKAQQKYSGLSDKVDTTITSVIPMDLGNRSDSDELQIYCDMDGVLVDFEQGVVNQINDDLKMLKARVSGKKLQALRAALKEIGRDYVTLDDLRGKSTAVKALRNYMYARVGDDEEFWANLPWMPNGRKLWDAIAHHNPYILTSPMREGSERGKHIWIKNNLKPLPEKVYMSHEKYKWADESSILIDDWSKNTVPWAEHDGIAIKHVDAEIEQTLARLEELEVITMDEGKERQAPYEGPYGTEPYQKKVKAQRNQNRKLNIGMGGNKHMEKRHKRPNTKKGPKAAPPAE
jgi:hypothetical protein